MRNGERMHRLASELFVKARGLDPADRSAFLDQACDGDDGLRDEVESLLAHDAGDDPVLDRPALGDGFRVPDIDGLVAGAPGRAGPLDRPDRPDRIGEYRVLRVLGEGGMGIVYLAEQPLTRRPVALKVLRAGAASPRTQARFEQEAEVLGLLDHPGIARVFEASTVSIDGLERMFFAMELVEGRPLTEHAIVNRLGLRRRIELLIETCDALHHAHLRGVVHRDLKPENILVPHTGRPKVLDFGVARLRESDVPRASRWTAEGQLIGTVSAMSPEQTLAGRADIDLRSDVYSLGVVAYELFSGRQPYDVTDEALDVALATVRNVDPPRLGGLRRELRGDLEAIVAKAMEKDRERRYASAADLAADLERHLEGLPIRARPITTMVQLSRFARRRKGLVAGLVATALVLIAGFAVMTKLTVEARREAERASLVNEFFVQMLRKVDEMRDGDDVTLIDALLELRSRIPEHFRDYPDLQMKMHARFGTTFTRMGLYAPAETELARAITLGAQLDDDDDDDDGGGASDYVNAQLSLAAVQLNKNGDVELTRSILASLFADDARALRPLPRNHYRALRLAAREARRREDFVAAETYAREAAAMEWGPEEGGESLRDRARVDVGRCLIGQQRFDEAQTLLATALEDMIARNGFDGMDVARGEESLATLVLARAHAGEQVPANQIWNALTGARRAYEYWSRARGNGSEDAEADRKLLDRIERLASEQ